jgi:hypothetical protein
MARYRGEVADRGRKFAPYPVSSGFPGTILFQHLQTPPPPDAAIASGKTILLGDVERSRGTN